MVPKTVLLEDLLYFLLNFENTSQVPNDCCNRYQMFLPHFLSKKIYQKKNWVKKLRNLIHTSNSINIHLILSRFKSNFSKFSRKSQYFGTCTFYITSIFMGSTPGPRIMQFFGLGKSRINQIRITWCDFIQLVRIYSRISH